MISSSSCDGCSGEEGTDARSIDGTGKSEYPPDPLLVPSISCSDSDFSSLCFFGEGGSKLLSPLRLPPDDVPRDGCAVTEPEALFLCHGNGAWIPDGRLYCMVR